MGSFMQYANRIFWKTFMSYPLIRTHKSTGKKYEFFWKISRTYQMNYPFWWNIFAKFDSKYNSEGNFRKIQKSQPFFDVANLVWKILDRKTYVKVKLYHHMSGRCNFLIAKIEKTASFIRQNLNIMDYIW